MKHFIFSYGTLQSDKIQQEVFKRILTGTSDVLHGFLLRQIEIAEYDGNGKLYQSIYPVAYRTNDPDNFVKGVLYEVTDDELRWADEYEGEHYQRKQFQLASGNTAWVYISADDPC